MLMDERVAYTLSEPSIGNDVSNMVMRENLKRVGTCKSMVNIGDTMMYYGHRKKEIMFFW